jgi:hypothetical protein
MLPPPPSGLLPLVAPWCRGAKFADLNKQADVFEVRLLRAPAAVCLTLKGGVAGGGGGEGGGGRGGAGALAWGGGCWAGSGWSCGWRR